jgi:RecA/RadA recombinase
MSSSQICFLFLLNNCITLVHGPPGTGKTTVIATYVVDAIRAGQRGIYLMAQSNVAVKNIAEKLAKFDFFGFKLLVSQGFHYEW